MSANTNRSAGAQTPTESRESSESSESILSQERTGSEEPTQSPEPTASQLLTAMIYARIEIYDLTIPYQERRKVINDLIDFFQQDDRSFTHMEVAEFAIFIAEHGGVVGMDTTSRQGWIRVCLDACSDGFEDAEELDAKARELDQVLEVQADRVMGDEGNNMDDADDDGEDEEKEYEEPDEEEEEDGMDDDEEGYY
ncbi:uncharacterized protein L3040_002410 [Drepanopeziza brunnea f. sp. 'multigermtubi']|uniref:Uncharacterized protein n=1 Tax=Marssonina brunnea f. sp. multigermtubi (strain MB_m1) TaxID=1072389 RepID=K1Y3Z8_MARBU|nr:uncharacterized protein MBM_01861 [Drepanopeziza brunnea f. sp. 'multigermtubi' MB_m1]EKD19909.1 hypothetical protein MBM_01861 [Drepanopeziza brunnea f. sp. 'multigermtubi' MB_m1]KAJ5050533.1 hypothetical protein L3040_002410 [Drepanopeziza brunnea f. sp. 'multigermtubi']